MTHEALGCLAHALKSGGNLEVTLGRKARPCVTVLTAASSAVLSCPVALQIPRASASSGLANLAPLPFIGGRHPGPSALPFIQTPLELLLSSLSGVRHFLLPWRSPSTFGNLSARSYGLTQDPPGLQLKARWLAGDSGPGDLRSTRPWAGAGGREQGTDGEVALSLRVPARLGQNVTQ